MPAPLENLNRDHQCHFYQAPTGQRCGSPALKGEYYCCFHHIRNAKRNQSRVLIDPEVTRMELPEIEDRASIFVALAAVVHRLAENTIDTRRAGQMIYGLQVAMRALEPPRGHRVQTSPAAEAPSAASSTAADTQAAGQPATCNSHPTPRTIQITKESLLYFLRSRHCYNCNVELFPPEELTERRHPGAPSEVIEEARPALPAPQPAIDDIVILSGAKNPRISPEPPPLDEPATDSVLPTLNAVASDPTSYFEPLFESTLRPRFALHSARRSVSLRLVCITRRTLAPGRLSPHRIS